LLKASGLKVPQGQFALQAQNFTAPAGQITGQLFKFYAASSLGQFNIGTNKHNLSIQLLATINAIAYLRYLIEAQLAGLPC